MTEDQILILLHDDPSRCMEELVTQYAGVLWSVCSQLLDDPEDIKECVNESFAQFFWQRDRFDPSKGTLKGYLAVIARRLAIKKLQANQKLAELTIPKVDEPDPIRSFEEKEALNSYLRTLDPMDEQIIRMKYYGGMTAREIADSLNLPYETVKKRHQRSLKKLRKAMTVGLIVTLLAALLAACAYVVLRYFGIVPGYGVNTDPSSHVYVLKDGPINVDCEAFQMTIRDAWWMNGILTLDGTAYPPEDSMFPNSLGYSTQYDCITPEGLTDPSMGVRSFFPLEDGSGEQFRLLWQGSLPEQTGNSLSLTLRWENGTSCPLTLESAEEEVPFQQAGYYDLTEESGGLLAIPRLENGELIVAIYPLNAGDYSIHPMLTSGPYTTFEPDCRDITVTAADGCVQVGEMNQSGQFSNNTYFEWNFGPAQPGEYTLNVPFVYQTLAGSSETEPLVLELPLRDETCALDISFPLRGGEVRLTCVTPVSDYTYALVPATDEMRAMNERYAEFRWWDVDVSFISTDPERTLAYVPVQLTDLPEQIPIQVNGSVLGLPRLMSMQRTEPLDNGGQTLLGLRIGSYDTDSARLLVAPQQVGYRWNRAFSIPFTVS